MPQVLSSTISVGKVSECVLILFRTTCGSGWPRCCHPLPNDTTCIPGGCVFLTNNTRRDSRTELDQRRVKTRDEISRLVRASKRHL